MGFWDTVKSVGKKVMSAVSPVKRIGEKVFGGIKDIGGKVNSAVRFGQSLLSKAENIGSKIGKLPVIGNIAKQVYENTPLKNIHQKVKQGLDTAERISGNVAKGDLGSVAKEMAEAYAKRKADGGKGRMVGADELD